MAPARFPPLENRTRNTVACKFSFRANCRLFALCAQRHAIFTNIKHRAALTNSGASVCVRVTARMPCDIIITRNVPEWLALTHTHTPEVNMQKIRRVQSRASTVLEIESRRHAGGDSHARIFGPIENMLAHAALTHAQSMAVIYDVLGDVVSTCH